MLCGDDAGIVFFEVDRVAAEINGEEVGVGEGYAGGAWVGGVSEVDFPADCVEGVVYFRS